MLSLDGWSLSFCIINNSIKNFVRAHNVVIVQLSMMPIDHIDQCGSLNSVRTPLPYSRIFVWKLDHILSHIFFFHLNKENHDYLTKVANYKMLRNFRCWEKWTCIGFRWWSYLMAKNKISLNWWPQTEILATTCRNISRQKTGVCHFFTVDENKTAFDLVLGADLHRIRRLCLEVWRA